MQTISLTSPSVADLLAPSPDVQVGLVLITPDMAKEIVAKHNPHNRTPSKASIDAYKADMLHDRWLFNGDPLRFDVHGELIDGQHRLYGVAEAGDRLKDGVPFLVIKGLPVNVQETIDAGRKRTVADQLNIGQPKEAEKLGTKIVAALRALFILSGIEGSGKMGGGRLTNSQLYELLRRHPKIVDSVKLVNKLGVSGNKMQVRPAVVAAIHYASQHLLKGVKGKGDAFVKALLDGKPTEGYTGTDPAWQLAQLWATLEARKHISENDAIKLVTLAWSTYAEGGEVGAKAFKHNMAAAEAIGITRKDVTGEEPEAKPEPAPEVARRQKAAKGGAAKAAKAKGAEAAAAEVAEASTKAKQKAKAAKGKQQAQPVQEQQSEDWRNKPGRDGNSPDPDETEERAPQSELQSDEEREAQVPLGA